MKVLYERVAGIDVHKDMVKVAIRSPGEKPWTRKTEILEFRTFYGVLQEMARELRRRGRDARGDGGQRGLHRAGVLRAVRAGLRAGRGDQPGARQGAEGPQDRRQRLRPAGGAVRVRAAARVVHPAGGAEGGAGPDPVQDEDGAGPHLGDPAAGQGAGIGRHQARLGCQQHNRHGVDRDDRGADRRGAPRRRAGGPGDRPDAHRGEAGGPVDGAGRAVHRASRAAVPPAPGPDRRVR